MEKIERLYRAAVDWNVNFRFCRMDNNDRTADIYAKDLLLHYILLNDGGELITVAGVAYSNIEKALTQFKDLLLLRG